MSDTFLLAGVADSPDGVGAVVAYQQGAVGGYGGADGAAPDVAVGEDEAGEEILILAGGVAGLVQRNANDFVSGANGFVPGAVFGGKDVAAISGRELLASVENKLQGCVVRLQENVGDDGFVF